MRKLSGYMVLLLILVSSCKPETDVTSHEGNPVIRVFDDVLFEDEVLQAIPEESSAEDSMSIRNSYINSWVNRKLMVHQAELNLPDSKKDVSQKLEQYRQDLLIFSYQNQLLVEKLDTVVSRTEIEEYYNEHQEMFQLTDFIVKARYIKFDSATFKNKDVKKWFMSDKETDFEKLEEFCYMHSALFSLDETWQYLDELLKVVPIVTYNKEKLLKNKKLIELYDNGYLYLMRIIDYKFKDSISPLELEVDNIKRIIINNRKIEFLNSLSTDIYQTAKNQNQIEVYVPK